MSQEEIETPKEKKIPSSEPKRKKKIRKKKFRRKRSRVKQPIEPVFCYIQTICSEPEKFQLRLYRNIPLKLFKVNMAEVEKKFNLRNAFLAPLKRIKMIVSPDDVKPEEKYLVDGDEIEEEDDDGTSVIKGYRTGIVHDEKMDLHFHLRSSIPEIPERVKSILETLETSSLMSELKTVKSREATHEELQLCHKKSYIKKLSGGKIKSVFGDYYICKDTFSAAKLSCGCVLSMCDSILTGKVDNGFVLSRPPGHHAKYDSPMGFCFFSNAAIAAKYMKKKYNDKVKRVLILDWDVHHGNGTQALRSNDKNILFISVHRNTYPNTGHTKNVGKKGNTVNIQFNKPYGNAEMLEAFSQVIIPISLEFRPDFIIVSAGYDAVRGDPLGKCTVSSQMYSYMTQLVMQLTGGKNICMILEGGYNITRLCKCVENTIRVMRGHEIKGGGILSLQRSYMMKETHWNDIREVIEVQSKFFQCMKMRCGKKDESDHEKLMSSILNSKREKKEVVEKDDEEEEEKKEEKKEEKEKEEEEGEGEEEEEEEENIE